jgi:hypothetical protein
MATFKGIYNDRYKERATMINRPTIPQPRPVPSKDTIVQNRAVVPPWGAVSSDDTSNGFTVDTHSGCQSGHREHIGRGRHPVERNWYQHLQWKDGLHLYDPDDVFTGAKAGWCTSSPTNTTIDELIEGTCSISDPPSKVESSHNVSVELLTLVTAAKASLSTIPSSHMHSIRAQTNRFECLSKGPKLGFPFSESNLFINRSAMKMVNMDYCFSVFNTDRTEPVAAYSPQSKEDGQFVFVDVCGGPGGFTEYILLKHELLASTDSYCMLCRSRSLSGFGISLLISDAEPDSHISCNWNLQHLDGCNSHLNISFYSDFKPTNRRSRVVGNTQNNAGTSSAFTIVNGVTKDGNIYKFANVQALSGCMQEQLGHGSTEHTVLAEFVCGDGGIETSDNVPTEVTRTETIAEPLNDLNTSVQELVNLRLILCQVYTMISTLAFKGNFVLKIYGCNEVSSSLYCSVVLVLDCCF